MNREEIVKIYLQSEEKKSQTVAKLPIKKRPKNKTLTLDWNKNPTLLFPRAFRYLTRRVSFIKWFMDETIKSGEDVPLRITF